MARNSGNSRFTALVLALVACPAALMAQSNTTAALVGVVKDPKGALLAGATVRVSSPSQIGGERVVAARCRPTWNEGYAVPIAGQRLGWRHVRHVDLMLESLLLRLKRG